MELYLQFGYGMMGLCRHFIERWKGGTVILSPRDLTGEQIQRLGKEIIERGGRTLVDPQFYDPRSTHYRLIDHDYWPGDFNTNMLSERSAVVDLLRRLLRLNEDACADRFIVPGLYCNHVNDLWLIIQDTLIAESARVVTDRPRIATVCLSGEVLRLEDQIEIIINAAEKWDVSGVYIVPEHPRNQYLVEDPVWVGNLLILCSGLKLQEKEVIVGYSNHQMLCMATARVDAIASGTWLNVRSFTTDKFHEVEPGEISRRAIWYYCPQAFSEYRVPFLDMAYRFGILELLRPEASLGSNYADILFSGVQPTSTDYSESKSFRHYLQCLHEQSLLVSRRTYRETFDVYHSMLNDAESLLKNLRQHGVYGQDRDFGKIVDVNRSALAALDHARGFVLERVW